MPTAKKSGLVRTLVVVALALSGVLYALADRYLIEHVEIAGVSAVSAQALATATPAATRTAEAADAGAATVTADAWHYQTDGLAITITQVSTGSGQSALTYFVADVVIADATQLQSAFAKDSFGRNIIEYPSQIAAAHEAIFAINGDYYGFRSDGIVIRNGVIYRDQPARVGLAFYRDGSLRIYDETQTSAQALLDAGVWNTLSFGPALLVDGVIPAGLESVEVDTNFGNHSIQGSHPRTGVGVIANNHLVFVVVDGRSPGYSRGVTLPEFAQIFADLGCAQAYNLDGGGSSTLYFQGRVVNNPLGKNQERGTSDILYLTP